MENLSHAQSRLTMSSSGLTRSLSRLHTRELRPGARGSTATGPVGRNRCKYQQVCQQHRQTSPTCLLQTKYQQSSLCAHLPGGGVVLGGGVQLQRGHEPHLVVVPGCVLAADALPHQGPGYSWLHSWLHSAAHRAATIEDTHLNPSAPTSSGVSITPPSSSSTRTFSSGTMSSSPRGGIVYLE